jgi:NAD(P)-dependent dehydrogenase (short-subunit alcohol dehydrogenase family)
MGKIDLEDLNWERRKYRRWPAYGQSKLANLQFMFELDRRLTAAGSPVRSVAAHPGYAATELQSRTGNVFQNAFMWVGNRVIAQSGEQGAWPTLYAATQDIPGGSYAGPDGRGEARGNPTLVGTNDAARDEDVARGLWELSERLTGVKFEIPRPAAVS